MSTSFHYVFARQSHTDILYLDPAPPQGSNTEPPSDLSNSSEVIEKHIAICTSVNLANEKICELSTTLKNVIDKLNFDQPHAYNNPGFQQFTSCLNSYYTQIIQFAITDDRLRDLRNVQIEFLIATEIACHYTPSICYTSVPSIRRSIAFKAFDTYCQSICASQFIERCFTYQPATLELHKIKFVCQSVVTEMTKLGASYYNLILKIDALNLLNKVKNDDNVNDLVNEVTSDIFKDLNASQSKLLPLGWSVPSPFVSHHMFLLLSPLKNGQIKLSLFNPLATKNKQDEQETSSDTIATDLCEVAFKIASLYRFQVTHNAGQCIRSLEILKNIKLFGTEAVPDADSQVYDAFFEVIKTVITRLGCLELTPKGALGSFVPGQYKQQLVCTLAPLEPLLYELAHQTIQKNGLSFTTHETLQVKEILESVFLNFHPYIKQAILK